MKYDKEVLTINNILTALDNFDNKEEIINAIKQSLYDIETDWHNEEYLRQQLQSYKDKEEKLRELIETYSCRFNKGFPYDKVLIVQGRNISENEYLDLEVILTDIEEILNEGK